MPPLNTKTSIVDKLKSTGQDSSYSARSALAKKNGITNYTGTSDQNNQLLSKVSAITPTLGYADSTTKAGQFSDSSSYINNRTPLPNDPANKFDPSTGKPNPNYKDPTEPTTDKTTPKMPTMEGVKSEVDNAQAVQLAKDKVWEEEQKATYEKNYQSNLSLVNSKYASTKASIDSLFGQRLEKLKKINALDLDRTKAYGMSNAQYMPLEYTDAITSKEKEQADEIASLDMQREALLQDAKYNMEQGKVDAVKGNQDSLTALEKTMENKLAQAQKNMVLQDKIYSDKLESQKKEYFDDMRQRALNAVSLYEDEFNKAKTTEERDALIKKAMSATNGNFNDLNQLTIYKQEFAKKTKETMTLKKDELALKNTESLINNRGGTGGTKKLTSAEKTKITQNAISDGFLYLKEYKSTKKQGGIDPTEYKDIADGLRKEHGASAVVALDKLIKDGKLRVDYGTTK